MLDPVTPIGVSVDEQNFPDLAPGGEIRLFVDGAGLFYLRFDDLVAMVRCERGDLLMVPAGTRHWFDMGARPSFCAIRFFGTPDGWKAAFTGDEIARRFPSFDELARGAA